MKLHSSSFFSRKQSSTAQIYKERPESCPSTADTKHVDSSEDDVDKACLSDSKMVLPSDGSKVEVAADAVEIHSIREAEWNHFQSSDTRMADVREISAEAEGNNLDIPVVTHQAGDHQPGGNSLRP